MRTGKLSAENQPKILASDRIVISDSVVSDLDYVLLNLIGRIIGENGANRTDKLATIFESVNGRCAPWVADYIYDAVKELNLDVSGYSLNFAFGRTSSVCEDTDSRTGYGLLIGRYPNDDETRFAIWHELRHIQQIKRGWLKPWTDGNSIWKGRIIHSDTEYFRATGDSIGYNSLPQEVDANIFAMRKMGNRYIPNMENCVTAANNYLKWSVWDEKNGVA
jgi:hypothetical protein